ncbi:uncharacterized protein BKCO1_25000116 [Diplodia corticola]|uniref:Uncharacterized protein n=1 Tax=Diplodia corticola TaxID=236234 RepID=A0A1J9S2D2_9PEZI|nr:uncharacterized protein BKCO1_25000116 [Diplodia corticola]OJD34164.1 hypothetical protein BKCO1_25000116 [Diplodia corticola]
MSLFASLPKYSQLASLDETIGGEQRPTTRRSRIGKAVTCIALGLLAFAATLVLLLALCILLVAILPRILTPSSLEALRAASPAGSGTSSGAGTGSGYRSGTGTPCGNSPAEAEAAGCIFDLMTVSWLAPECYDAELTAQFLEDGPWLFYLSNSTLPEAPPAERELIPSLEAIGRTTDLMWTDRRFHIYHCIYGWKMMHRAIERGWKMESSLTSYHHTEHCADTLANTTVPMDAVITRVDLSYPAC